MQNILLITLACINLLTFALTAYDKRKAIHGHSHNRTPEGLIFFWAAMFGAVGVYLAMLAFRHKTRKWYFQIGIPLLIVQNLATIYLLSTL